MPTKLKVKGDDPKKPTPKEIEAANQFAKQFTARKGLMIAGDAHVGSQVPKFTGAVGLGGLPPNTVTDIRMIPSYVTDKDIFVTKEGVHGYTDQQTGDFKPIHPDIVRSSRFNPNRGKSAEQLLVKR